MNEEAARQLVLVRAIETADRNFELLGQDDRVYASRAATELARWQASDTGADVTPEQFLQQRAKQVLTKITERTPTFSRILERRNALAPLSFLLPPVSFLAGFGLDRITDPHRVDLLSIPLLLIIGWNLLVYAAMFVWACIPSTRDGWNPGAMLRAFENRNLSLPRKLPGILALAIGAFAVEWATLSSKLTSARVGRAVHVLTVMMHLMQRGQRIPRDVAVISRDSETFLEHTVPSVTRYAMSSAQFARRVSAAARQLADTGFLPPRGIRLMQTMIPGETG